MSHQGKAYTDEEKEQVINRIADGLMDGQSLRKICSADDMPNKATVLRWMEDEENQHLTTIIARARSLQSEAKFDDMDDIMAEVRSGDLDPQAARVIIWGIQWQLSKLRPKKYGEKQQIEHSGRVDYSDLSLEELERKLQELRQGVDEAD